ncbi:unnamed protein product, partial [Ectocarpus sp. 12 AP-2014]
GELSEPLTRWVIVWLSVVFRSRCSRCSRRLIGRVLQAPVVMMLGLLELVIHGVLLSALRRPLRSNSAGKLGCRRFALVAVEPFLSKASQPYPLFLDILLPPLVSLCQPETSCPMRSSSQEPIPAGVTALTHSVPPHGVKNNHAFGTCCEPVQSSMRSL